MNERALRVLEFYKIKEMLMGKSESSIGKALIENLIPSKDIEIIEKLQAETYEALSILNSKGNPPLRGIHDLNIELKRCGMGGMLSPGSLLKIAQTLRTTRNLKTFIKVSTDNNEKYSVINELIINLNTYKDIEDKIFNAIISEEELSDNASSTLKNIRRQKNVKNEAVKSKLNSIINSSSKKKYLQESIITIRGDRYVVPVKSEFKGSFPGLVHDQSSSGATLFIEPMEVVNLNNEIKELKIQELKEIERILKELSGYVALNEEEIWNNQSILAKLDFIFAKGKLASAMKGIKPILNDEGYINIIKGRHPLIDADVVVPTNIYLGENFTTLVITGPNTGGKTVTLKTVGLLTLMAQAGLHIPADSGSKINIFDEVFADIGDEQSIEQSLSTFSSHMTNIVNILKNYTDKSLILFDELGAGTDPTEGAALAMSILDHLKVNSVRTIATTHYSELKLYALSTDNVENASVEFDVNTLSPTYNLIIGIPGKSNAFEISKRLGLQEYIISDAKEILSKDNVEFEDVLATIEKEKVIARKNREETDKLKDEISRLKAKLDEKKKKFEDSKEKYIKEAKIEAKNIVKLAKKEADTIISDLRNISVEIEKDKNKKIQESKNKLNDKLNVLEKDLSEDIFKKVKAKPPKNLKVGDDVKVLTINQKGTVLTKPDKEGNLTVQIGIMKMNVNISSLVKIKSEEEKKVRASTKNIIKSKSVNIKSEIDLRGSNLDEAILDVDKYLDDAYLANLKIVSIIHGKGTGVLREGIKQLLKSHRHVKSFRLGELGEGGSGVTIVNLK